MRQNRMIHALLAAAVSVSLAAPVGAMGQSSFQDVQDPGTALNADILRLMGVVAGTGDNAFHPNQTLTRAQFCAMAINFMGLGDQVVLHSTRTIFNDVPSSHWARGYVNLAASTTLGGGGSTTPTDGDTPPAPAAGTPLIAGVGDGRFLPDEPISCAQAITILIRVLGYSSQQVGAVWPDGYLNLAQSIGLRDGLTQDYNAPLTRSQAAQLFVNALDCKDGQGKQYFTTLGTVKKDTVLLAVNASADDGSSQGAIRTSQGTYLPNNEHVSPTALVGCRGSLVLNDQEEVVTFVPDDSTSVTITLSGNAEPSSVKAAEGSRYTISGDTPVFTSSSEESKPYAECYNTLLSGSQITLFTERGKVVAIYSGAAATGSSTDAVVVTGSVHEGMFHGLTGGVTGYTILKNQQPISISQIKPYDVVTYDSLSNTLIVSDLHLSCIYEDAAPNSKAPATISVLGHEFPVLESAWSSTSSFTVGDPVTLLLTADGKVAGMESASTLSSNAIGYVSEGSKVQMFLPNGGTVELVNREGELKRLDQVLQISSTLKGKINLTSLSGSGIPGDFDPSKLTLGNLTVARGVRIYEQVSSDAQVPISLGTLSLSSIPKDKIAAYHQNSSGVVSVIVLHSVTGDAYTYGRLTESWQNPPVDHETNPDGDRGNRIVTLENGSGTKTYASGYHFEHGTFGGVATGSPLDGSGTNRAASIIALTEIKNVKASDFFEDNGHFYVTVGGKTYPVSADVECYKSANKSWFTQKTGEERLNACKAFSSDLSIHIDPVGGKVRIVTAN